MNAVDLLIGQHKTVNGLFAQVTHYDKFLEYQITRNLIHHADIEEQHFYPALLGKKETKDLVSHSMEEHAEVKNLLLKWERQTGQAWIDTAQEIISMVQHHVKEEETKVFPKAREVFSEKELEDLGEKMA